MSYYLARIVSAVFLVQILACSSTGVTGTSPAASETIQKVLQAAVCLEPILRAPAPPAQPLAVTPSAVIVVPSPEVAPPPEPGK